MNVQRVRALEAMQLSTDAVAEHLVLAAAGFRLQRPARLLDYADGHSVLRLCWLKTVSGMRIVARGSFKIVE